MKGDMFMRIKESRFVKARRAQMEAVYSYEEDAELVLKLLDKDRSKGMEQMLNDMRKDLTNHETKRIRYTVADRFMFNNVTDGLVGHGEMYTYDIGEFFNELVEIAKKDKVDEFYPNIFDCHNGCCFGSVYVNGRCVFRNKRLSRVANPMYVSIGIGLNKSSVIDLDSDTARIGYFDMYASKKNPEGIWYISGDGLRHLLQESIRIGKTEGFEYK